MANEAGPNQPKPAAIVLNSTCFQPVNESNIKSLRTSPKLKGCGHVYEYFGCAHPV